MDAPQRHPYNPPWRQVGAAFCFCAIPVILACFVSHKAQGLLFWSLVIFSAPFVFLALVLLVGQVAFPRTLELTESAVLLPGGFMRKQLRRIAYTDISSSWEYHVQTGLVLQLVTPAGNFEILASMLPDATSYQTVKNFIQSKIALNLSQNNPQDPPAKLMPWLVGVEPILKWREPEAYELYRTHLVVTAQPLARRIFKLLAFNCYWFFPGLLVLWFFHQPLGEFLIIGSVAGLLFAWLYWYNMHHPARCGEISFHHSYIYEKSGKQSFSVKYQDISGWALIERTFEGQPIHVLLLKCHQDFIRSWALSEDVRHEPLVQLLHDKHIPEVPELKPSWEK